MLSLVQVWLLIFLDDSKLKFEFNHLSFHQFQYNSHYNPDLVTSVHFSKSMYEPYQYFDNVLSSKVQSALVIFSG